LSQPSSPLHSSLSPQSAVVVHVFAGAALTTGADDADDAGDALGAGGFDPHAATSINAVATDA